MRFQVMKMLKRTYIFKTILLYIKLNIMWTKDKCNEIRIFPEKCHARDCNYFHSELIMPDFHTIIPRSTCYCTCMLTTNNLKQGYKDWILFENNWQGSAVRSRHHISWWLCLPVNYLFNECSVFVQQNSIKLESYTEGRGR